MSDRDLSRDLSQPSDTRPAPFSSLDCDLRGLEWMPLNAADLLDSTLWLESDGWEFKAAMGLICKSWRQVPAGSLPNSDVALAQLASVPVPWEQVRTMALRNWVLCSDGRYYHPIVAAKAMEALPMRQEYEHKKSSEAERKERERRERKEMFAKLRAAGIVMKWDTKTGELRAAIARLVASRDLSQDLSRDQRDSKNEGRDSPTPPVSADSDAKSDSTDSGDQSSAPASDLTHPADESRDLSRDVSRDLSRLRQGQGQGPLLQNPSGSVGATPASPSPPPPASKAAKAPKAATKRRGDASEPEPGELLEGPKQRSARPYRKCPDTFRLTAAMVQWANEEYPILDFDEVRKATRAFLNHRYRTARIEWVPTWENWIKEEAERKASRARPAGGAFQTTPTPRQQRVAQHFAASAERPTTPQHRGPPPRPLNGSPATQPGEIEDVESRPASPAIGR